MYLDYRPPQDCDRYPLARDVVRFIGDPVAVVVAEDRDTAIRALSSIRVKYRRLPVVDTVAKALAAGAPAIHDRARDNVARRVSRSFGDADAARRATAHEVAARYVSSRQAHAIMEPHTVLCDWDADAERLNVWAPTQNPRKVRRDIAHVLGIEPEQVRMREVAIGGDFGGRSQVCSIEVLAGAASMATGRPVKIRESRSQEFAFSKSRYCWDIGVRLGADDTGRATFLDADFDVDNGAYNLSGPHDMEFGSIALGSSYRWRSYDGSGRCVYTNKQPPSSFRGAGGFQVNWTLECAIDELADEVGIDPIDFRCLNAVSAEGETSTTGWEVRSSRLIECLQTVRERMGWDDKRQFAGHGRGVGIACSVHITGLRRQALVTSAAAIDVGADGSVCLRSGCGDAGTGQKTIIAQAVAEVLGLGVGRIAVTTMDTDSTPVDAGAGASRGTYHSVSAAKQTAETLRDALVEAAASKFHVGKEDIAWRDGHAHFGEEQLGLADLAALLSDTDDGSFTVESTFVGPFHQQPEDGYEDIAPAYSFAAHGVEVDVNLDTGQVKVVRVVAAHDSGTIINPITARGQVEGGVLMGLGAALSEELIYEHGRVVNPSYVDYGMARATDFPAIETIFLESDDPEGPFGAKGLGEIVLLPIGSALTNAVSHAIGARIREAPLTPDKVLQAYRARHGLPPTVPWRIPGPKHIWVAGMRMAYPKGLHALLARTGPHLRGASEAGRVRRVLPSATATEAIGLLRTTPDATAMGGGIDLLSRETQELPIASTFVHVANCAELADVRRDAGDLVLGAAVTLEAIATNEALPPALRRTAAQIGSLQLRTTATLAGNLCQAKRCWFYRNGFDCYKRSGATRPCYAVMGDHRFHHAVEGGHRCQAVTPSDLATTLIALDAVAVVQGADGERDVLIEDLFDGPGEVALTGSELITRVRIPRAGLDRTTYYRKFALWGGAFAVTSVAVSASMSSPGIADDIRVAIGGVAPTPQRLRRAESLLRHRPITPELAERAAQQWLRRTHPLKENHWKAFASANLLTATILELSGNPSL
jgi:CO/xanthine dehydrogenase Mo-binding subunit/CO/xanthine dehydrogenase FAD-binding subunit